MVTELFQIGVRNPQGMTYDPVSKKFLLPIMALEVATFLEKL